MQSLGTVDLAIWGNYEHEQAFLAVDNQREVWNPAERELIEKAEPFLEEALNIYYQKQE